MRTLDKIVGWKTHVVSRKWTSFAAYIIIPTTSARPILKRSSPLEGTGLWHVLGVARLLYIGWTPQVDDNASHGHFKLGTRNNFMARPSPSFVLGLCWGLVSQFLFRLFSLKARLHGAMKIEILKFCMQTALKYFRPVSFQWRLSEKVWNPIEWDSDKTYQYNTRTRANMELTMAYSNIFRLSRYL